MGCKNNGQKSGMEGKIMVGSAKYFSDYTIRIRFSDGKEKLIYFKPFYPNHFILRCQ